VLHDKDLAEAIIDRVLARGRLIELRGTSYRTRHLKNTKDDGAQPLEQSARVSGISGPEFPEPTGPDPWHGRLAAGVIAWVSAFVGFVRLRPRRAAPPAAAADAGQAARG